MAVLTPAQITTLGRPPKPLPPTVQLIDPRTGKPTKEFTDWLERVYAWHVKLYTVLTT